MPDGPAIAWPVSEAFGSTEAVAPSDSARPRLFRCRVAEDDICRAGQPGQLHEDLADDAAADYRHALAWLYPRVVHGAQAAGQRLGERAEMRLKTGGQLVGLRLQNGRVLRETAVTVDAVRA